LFFVLGIDLEFINQGKRIKDMSFSHQPVKALLLCPKHGSSFNPKDIRFKLFDLFGKSSGHSELVLDRDIERASGQHYDLQAQFLCDYNDGYDCLS
jgi:hypothetical protein